MSRSRSCLWSSILFFVPETLLNSYFILTQLYLLNKDVSRSSPQWKQFFSYKRLCGIQTSPGKENILNVTLGDGSCPVNLCICVCCRLFPSWSASQNSQTFGHPEQIVCSLLALHGRFPVLQSRLPGSARWAGHFTCLVLGECSHMSLQNHPACSSSVFHLGLVWIWLPHSPTKLLPHFHSVSFRCYSFQTTVISFQHV